MKILIPILGFAKQGGYRVLSELANNWIKMGYECTFLIPATSELPYFPTEAKITRCGLQGVVDVADVRKTTGLNNILSLYFGLRNIGFDYDVILANHSLTAWPVRWANCGLARKFYYIQAYEPGYFAWLAHPFKRVLSKLSYELKLIRVANSSTYAVEGVDCDSIIPPGVDLNIFTKKKTDGIDFLKRNVVIGTIGRVEPYKGTATAIAAYKKSLKKYPNLTMKVAFGNVKPFQGLEVVEINNDNELALYYKSLDILIVSCYSQHGAPHYPLIEGMASGVPVVHTKYYPGDSENSWIAASPTVEDVANTLQELLETPADKILQRISLARKTIEENLSWESVAAKFIVLFEED